MEHITNDIRRMVATRGTVILFCMVGLLLLVGCDSKENVVGSRVESDVDSAPSQASKSKTVDDIQSNRLKDANRLGLTEGYHSTDDMPVPDDALRAVVDRQPEGFSMPSVEPSVDVEEVRFGQEARMSQEMENQATATSEIDLTAPLNKENTVPAVVHRGKVGLASQTIYFTGYSFVDLWFGGDYVDMVSYTFTSDAVTYLDVITDSYVDFTPVFSGYDYTTNGTFAGVWFTYQAWYYGSGTWYIQFGDHYVYDQGSQYPDGYVAANFYSQAYEYVYNF